MGIPPFFSVIQGLAFWYVFVSLTEKDGKRWEKVLHFLKSIQYPVLLFFLVSTHNLRFGYFGMCFLANSNTGI